MRGAVATNALCEKLHLPVERLRAGEHHVLQVLAAPPFEEALVLTSSAWLPVLRGELRLFTGGISLDCEQHGPHLLPFRIHLAAAATFRRGDRKHPSLLMLRQKDDAHGYGPLSLLPAAPGDGGGEVDPECPPMRSLALALVVPPRSPLQDALDDIVWPIWRTLFDECAVPCDDHLPGLPAEFDHALGVLRAANNPLAADLLDAAAQAA